MAVSGRRWTSALLAIVGALVANGVLGAQTLPPCSRSIDLRRPAIFAGVAVAGTAGQKVGAQRAAQWGLSQPATAASLWNDSQTPAHIFASFQLTKIGADAFGRCSSKVTAAWRGAAYAGTIGIAKEIADGFYDGFNPGDLAADGAGVSLALLQAYLPRLESSTMTMSLAGLRTVRTPRGQRFGAAGQAMWLSLAPHDLLPASLAARWPAPLRMSVGRRSPADVRAVPDYSVTLDIDASRLMPSRGPLRHARGLLHTLHLPAPGLLFANGQRPRFTLIW